MSKKAKKIISCIFILFSFIAIASGKDYKNIFYVEYAKFGKVYNKRTGADEIVPVKLKYILKENDMAAYEALKDDNRFNRILGYYKYDDGSVVYQVDRYKIWSKGNELYIHDVDMSEEYKLTLIYDSEEYAKKRCKNIRRNMEIILDERGIDYLDAYLYRINWIIEKLGSFNNKKISDNKSYNEKYNNSICSIDLRNDSVFEKNFFRATMILTKENLDKLNIESPDKYSLSYEAMKFGESL